jgi:NADPH:quinone reductase-like Zn-dependent oxidoreductase
MKDTLMKAIVCTRYGPPEVLQLREVEKPVPKNNEVLVRVYATAVHSGDRRMRSLDLSGVSFPQRIMARLVLGATRPRKPILGLWLSGEIESTGKSVKRFRVGDKVYARTPDMQFGAYAQYTCLPENSIMALKPANVTYEEAVAVPFGGLTALYFLGKGAIRSGQKVLIYGASGAVGTSAIQLARYYGAEVTGVCSTSNLELVKSLGAERVIDYTREDFTKRNELFDIVFDAVGKISYSKSKGTLKPKGKYVSVVASGHAKMETKDLVFLTKLVEAGDLKPVIDRCYPLEQMAEAHRYVDQGHKRGNVVITVGHDGEQTGRIGGNS